MKALLGILCLVGVSLINDKRAFTSIAARSKLIDSYSVDFKC